MTTDSAPHWTADLVRLRACSNAVKWCRDYPSLDAAWAACPRGDWMLWLLDRLSGEAGSPAHRAVVLAACECARLALPIFELRYPGDARARESIETTARWARGEPGVTLDDVHRARQAALAAADAASAAYAAYAAAYAAYAAYAASAYDAAAASAAYAASAYDARTKTLAACADIVRMHFPTPPTITGTHT